MLLGTHYITNKFLILLLYGILGYLIFICLFALQLSHQLVNLICCLIVSFRSNRLVCRNSQNQHPGERLRIDLCMFSGYEADRKV